MAWGGRDLACALSEWPGFNLLEAEWLAITTKAVLAAANYIITPGMQFNYIPAAAASTAPRAG